MTGHDEHRLALGSYLVGALDPAERTAVETHLAGCPACREELASHAGLPGLMSRLTLDEAQGDVLVPPATLLPGVLSAVERERHRGAKRLRRWQAGASVAAVATAASVVAAVGLPGAGPTRVGFSSAIGVVASGDLAVDRKPWGTALHLRVHVPDAPSYVAWAVDEHGTRTVAASWGRTPGGRMQVDGATGLDSAALRSVVVATAAGTPLLRLTRGGS